MSKTSGPDAVSVSPMISLIAGGAAGGVESLVTYPFEFAKTRVQLREQGQPGPTTRDPLRVISRVTREEGLRALYKGCSAAIIGSIAKDGIRFVSFDAIKRAFRDPETESVTPTRSILAGMSAGSVSSIFASTPTERIKIASIDDARAGRQFASVTAAVRSIYSKGGFMALYHGFAATTSRQCLATGFRMGTYNILKDAEKARHVKQSTFMNFANGAVAGTIATLGTQPFDAVKTRSQSVQGSGAKDAFFGILADHGPKGLWRGTTMRLSRTMSSGGILFTVYEQLVWGLTGIWK